MGAKDNCDKCKYFARMPTPACHKRSPTVHLVGVGGGQVQIHSIFPPTMADNWCGEFEPTLELAIPQA